MIFSVSSENKILSSSTSLSLTSSSSSPPNRGVQPLVGPFRPHSSSSIRVFFSSVIHDICNILIVLETCFFAFCRQVKFNWFIFRNFVCFVSDFNSRYISSFLL
jgi:hypothetical protein